jgi:hypothetical protein
MTFEALYKMVSGDSIIIESPDYLEPINSIGREDEYLRIVNDLTRNYSPIATIYYTQEHPLKIYEILENDEHRIYVVSSERVLAGMVYYTEFGDGITVHWAWNLPIFFNLIRLVYKDFLLDKYPFVMSDSFLTLKGFNMYKKMIHDKDLSIYTKDVFSGEEIITKTEKDLEDTYGSPEDIKYRFIIRKNNRK